MRHLRLQCMLNVRSVADLSYLCCRLNTMARYNTDIHHVEPCAYYTIVQDKKQAFQSAKSRICVNLDRPRLFKKALTFQMMTYFITKMLTSP